MTRRSHGLANRPGELYPATFHLFQWTHRDSNPDCRHARAVSSRWTMSPKVERRGIEPRLPGCKPSVFPLDHEPVWFLFVFVEPLTVPHFTFVLFLESPFGVSHPPKGSTHCATHLSAAFSCGFTSSVHSGAPGNRTPITWVQAKRLPVGPAPRDSKGPSGN